MSETLTESPGFTRIQKSYVDSLPKRYAELQSAWDRLKHVNWDKQVLLGLRNAVHKLHGSGQTFHYPRISDRARVLEQLLQIVLDAGEAQPEQRLQIDAALQALREVMDEAVLDNGQNKPVSHDHALVVQLHAHVAVIEDDAHQAALIRHWLEQAGYEVSVFTHPSAFANALASDFFNIALLDIGFHADSLEGVLWLEQVKNRLGDMPVIIMSARTDMVARLRALRAGAKAYLPKPLDAVVLHQKIQEILHAKVHSGDRVLLVDDDEMLLEAYQISLVAAGFEVATLSQPLQLLQKLNEFRPDAVVLDYQMPGCDGLELGRLMRHDPDFMTLPIVFVSASVEAVACQEVFSIVGNAFLPKPVDLLLLAQSLRQQIARARLVRSRIEQVSQRQNDQRLQNRAYFLGELEAQIARLQSESGSDDTLLAYVSVDQAGYLKERGRPLALARQEEAIETFLSGFHEIAGTGCTLGAMNYLVLMHAATTGTSKLERAEQLRAAFKASPCRMALDNITLTVSIGVVSISEVSHLEEAIESAESACARALKTGGDRVECVNRAAGIAVKSAALTLTPLIQNALKARAFKLVYQPIVNLECEDTWFEVLIRLMDEQDRVYLPSQFLPWVDTHVEGGSFSLDRFVIENAVKTLSELRGKAAAVFAVIIKLAPELGQLERLLPYISNVIKAGRLRGEHQVMFAMPESCVLKDIARANKLLNQLNSLHCGFMLEQVGPSGHALHVLRDLGAVDFVKLSPEWCRRAASDASIRAEIKHLMQAAPPGMRWVASNIEDAKSFVSLWELGLRCFQGYFIQQPAEAMASVSFSGDLP